MCYNQSTCVRDLRSDEMCTQDLGDEAQTREVRGDSQQPDNHVGLDHATPLTRELPISNLCKRCTPSFRRRVHPTSTRLVLSSYLPPTARRRSFTPFHGLPSRQANSPLTPIQHPRHPDQRPKLISPLAPRRQPLLLLSTPTTPWRDNNTPARGPQVPDPQHPPAGEGEGLPVPSPPLGVRGGRVPEPQPVVAARQGDARVAAAQLGLAGRADDDVEDELDYPEEADGSVGGPAG